MQYVTTPSFLITSMAAKIVTMESQSFNWMVGAGVAKLNTTFESDMTRHEISGLCVET